MPRVKFDYVVSFSSEDPDNPASNLLSWEVNKKKWLCGAGESSGSAVVQFDKAVKMETVQLGAHHCALVELLVGRSETPDQPYQVLVSSCVFLSPAESRRSTAAVDKVRSFTHTAGDAGVWAQRWDRLRIVVSQPYNKHCKFGISFVHVFTADRDPEPAPAPVTSLPARLRTLDHLSSSDDEEFRPGELFKQHTARAASNTTDTGAQIRRATSEAFKNTSDYSSKLVKAPLSKDKHLKHDENSNKKHKPHDNTDKHTTEPDHRVSDDSIKTRNERHVDGRTRDDSRTDTQTPGTKRKRDDQSDARTQRRTNVDTPTNKRRHTDQQTSTHRPTNVDTPTNKRKRDAQTDNNRNRQTDTDSGDTPSHTNKRDRDDTGTTSRRESNSIQTTCKDPSGVLAGVVCVLSGYVHPQRGDIRRTAAALGAQVRPDWGPHCTHLICAFPKTPKLSYVRSSPGGDKVPIVLGEWVTECARARRRLPEDWFATEPHRRTQRPQQDTIAEEPGAVSDDEIDFVPGVDTSTRDTSTRDTSTRDTSARDTSARDTSTRDTSARDTSTRDTAADPERSRRKSPDPANFDVDLLGAVEGHKSGSDDYDCSTDDEGRSGPGGVGAPGPGGALPALLEGVRVASSAPALLQRYVRAYGGTIATMEEMEMAHNEAEGDDMVYVVCGDDAGTGGQAGTRGRRVRPQWVWDCHSAQTRVHIQPYLI